MTTPSNDRTLLLLVDAASKVMDTASQDVAALEKAIKELNQARDRIEQSLRNAKIEAVRAIDASAETTATKAAQLLSKHFVEADKAAIHATDRYNTAANRLTRKWFAVWFSGLLATVLGALFFVWLMIPSLDQIQERRAQIKAMEVQVADLESRGGHLILGACGADKKKHLCFRTREKDAIWCNASSQRYAIPWGY